MKLSAMFDTINALATIATAAVPAGTKVFDGPVAQTAAGQRYMLIGVIDAQVSQGFLDAAVGQQTWVGIGARDRDENFTVYGVAVAWAAAGPFKTFRDQAAADVSALGLALRSNVNMTTVDYPGGTALFGGITVDRIAQIASTKGPVVQVAFSVACRARI